MFFAPVRPPVWRLQVCLKLRMLATSLLCGSDEMKIVNPSMLAGLVLTCVGLPALAQVDLTGEWVARYHEDFPERIPGPELGDYLGLPINDAARLRAESWDASILTLPEFQCRPHASDYATRHSNVRIWKEVDTATQQVIAYHLHKEWQAQERTIWMDGRPHPPEYAPHTWQGFSTGKWEGPMLTITTTHLKEYFIRRNGVPRSEKATVVEHWYRHGDYLTMATIITDPVYLTEPFIRTSDYYNDQTHEIPPYPCESVTEVQRPVGQVPHFMPDHNPFLTEFANRYQLPAEATRGGAETMYPEYRLKLVAMPVSSTRAQN
jgi:hypothetical protein